MSSNKAYGRSKDSWKFKQCFCVGLLLKGALNSPRKGELLGFMSRKMHCVIRKGPTEACNQAPTFPKLFFFFVLLLEKIFFPSNCKPHLKASSPVHSLEKLQLDTTSDKKIILKLDKAKAIQCKSLFRVI